MRTGSDHLQVTKRSPAQEVASSGPCGMSISDTSFFFSFSLSLILLHLVCDKHKSLEFLDALLSSSGNKR